MDKKGISIMIGYVLLVTSAIIIGVLVYQWLVSFVPKDILKCPDGVSMFIEDMDFNCTTFQLNVTLQNNGRFNIGGYFIHSTNSSTQTLATLDLSKNIVSGGINRSNSIVFDFLGENSFKPDDKRESIFNLTDMIYLVEVIPARFQIEDNRERFVTCEDLKVKEKVICSVGGGAPTESCGNGVCGSGECNSCPQDCNYTDCCGDGTCNNEETCGDSDTDPKCNSDCGECLGDCGDGTCDIGDGECNFCFADCDHIDCCGDGTCNNEETCGDSDDEPECMTDCEECDASSCDGIWNPPEDIGIECDGTPLPENCLANCTCGNEYISDENGGCTIPSTVQGCNDWCDFIAQRDGFVFDTGICQQSPNKCDDYTNGSWVRVDELDIGDDDNSGNHPDCDVDGVDDECDGDEYCIGGAQSDTCCCYKS